jgi:3-oxoacyl-(acyl-carrier-protein) synthase
VPRVFITGIGIISAIGFDAGEVYQSLRNGRSGVGKLTLIDSVYQDEIPVAEIKANLQELMRIATPKINGYYTRNALLGLIAARQAVWQAALDRETLRDTALISGTTVGGMDRSEGFIKGYLAGTNKGMIRQVSGHDCGDSTEKIAENLGIKGYMATLNTACSSSANAIMMGARLIKQGKAKKAVAGGVDCLTRFTLNGFNSLMILDRAQCRPFDENRNGLNLGEGSAFVVLESEDDVVRTGKTPLAEVGGYGNACDAYHQTASSPEGHGAFLSMQKALDMAHLSPADISYINTHGTGTKNNDLSEGVAIERLYGNNVPPCSSTKSFTGHTLAAAGAIEAVISTLAIQNNCLFPNLNYSEQMHELTFVPIQKYRPEFPLTHVMSNSFGFGGNNSSLIFSRI